MTRSGWLPALVAGIALAGCAGSPYGTAPPPENWAGELADWQTERADGLRAEEGWLSLAGLHWLRPGPNTVGNHPDAAVRLEADGLPETVGTMHLDDELRVRFEVSPEATVTLDGGEAVRDRVLHDDNTDTMDRLRAGRLLFYVIRRGERVGVRVKDPEHPNRSGFVGLDFYEPDPSFRVRGVWRAHEQPVTLDVPSVIGGTTEQASHGVIVFELGGKRHTLQPLTDGPDDLEPWLVFKDETAGRETYGAGRFLVAEREAEGEAVTLDFNRAYNPPCAYTPYATCPLPPPGNTVAARVEAGEKTYRGAH